MKRYIKLISDIVRVFPTVNSGHIVDYIKLAPHNNAEFMYIRDFSKFKFLKLTSSSLILCELFFYAGRTFHIYHHFFLYNSYFKIFTFKHHF